MEALSLAAISNSSVTNCIKQLRSSESVALDGIPSFILKSCSQTLQAAIFPVFNKGKRAAVGNYSPIAIINIFSKVFKFIVYHHVSHF
jgi:hypothetical protein